VEDKFIKEQQQGEPPATTMFNTFDTPRIKQLGGMVNCKRAVTMEELLESEGGNWAQRGGEG
jgi:hypothetical protein